MEHKERGRMMVKVTCQVSDYSEPRKAEIKIHNHWRTDNLVEIQILEDRYTVDGSDLIHAVMNCMNTNRRGEE